MGRARRPKLGALMDASREDVLACMDCPRERCPRKHWPSQALALASTGPRERWPSQALALASTGPRKHWPRDPRAPIPSSAIGREIKRRSDVVGIVPNDAAVLRPVGAPMLEASVEWAATRRTMSLKALARACKPTPSACPPQRPDQLTPLQRPALPHHPAGHDPMESVRDVASLGAVAQAHGHEVRLVPAAYGLPWS